MAGKPERDVEQTELCKAAYKQRIKSKPSEMAKRLRHIDWYCEDEEEYWT